MKAKPSWLPSLPEFIFSLIAFLVIATLAQGAHRCYKSESTFSYSCFRQGVEAQIQDDIRLFIN